MSLVERLKKQSKNKFSAILSESLFFNETEMVETPIPMINVALSGKLNGGISPGLTILAGVSKHFKSGFALLMAASYLKKYDDAVLLFYDSEFGAPQSYFKNFGIDTSRVLHTPVMNIEQLKFDLIGQLEELDRKDKVIIIIDSLGNIASKKEVEDAINEKSVADMTRAKAMKSLFRMITPYLCMKDIPMFGIAHTYKDTSSFFPTDIVGGGTALTYAANDVWIIGRQTDKDGKDVQGYHFVINIAKSRTCKEKSKIPISVSFKRGVEKWSGLLECGLESGYIKKPKNGWYAVYDNPNDEDSMIGKMVRAKDTNTKEFWGYLLNKEEFREWIERKYSLSTGEEIIINDGEEDED